MARESACSGLAVIFPVRRFYEAGFFFFFACLLDSGCVMI